jgi:outer membrane receptor protein involved in Fe transport
LQQGLLVDSGTGECFDPTGGCVPVNIFGVGNLSPQAAEFVRIRPLLSLTDRKQHLVSGFIRGKLFDLWAGPVETSLGGEWRRDSGRFEADEFLFTNDSLGYPGEPPVLGREEVYEAFAEILVPLVEGRTLADHLALELGYRYSNYEHANSVDTYKVGLEWRVTSGFGFRSMFQRAVRAPNLWEAFQEQQVSMDFLVTDDPRDDPCSASSDPVGNGNVDKCIATGLPEDQIGVFDASQFPTRFISGGNPDLESERADTVTAGFVLTPGKVPNLQVSVDYFNIEIKGEIGELATVEACFDPANPGGLFCNEISRDALTYNVNEVREYNINRGVARTSGVDTQLSYVTGLPGFLAVGDAGADLSVNIMWSHVVELTSQNTPFSSVIDCAGTFGWPCTDLIDGMTWPTDRVTSRLGYVSGPFAANLTWRWVDGSRNGAYVGAPLVGIPVSDLDLAVPDVKRKNYFDVSFSYLLGDHVMGLLTVANLTDTGPPMMADWVWDKNTDTRMYDIFGRSYTLSFSFHY